MPGSQISQKDLSLLDLLLASHGAQFNIPRPNCPFAHSVHVLPLTAPTCAVHPPPGQALPASHLKGAWHSDFSALTTNPSATGHSVQVPVVEYWPTAQSTHVAPMESGCLPGSHATQLPAHPLSTSQVAASWLLVSVRNPAGHNTQFDAPALAYSPMGHGAQTSTASVWARNSPAAQGMQRYGCAAEIARVGATVPPGHHAHLPSPPREESVEYAGHA